MNKWSVYCSKKDIIPKAGANNDMTEKDVVLKNNVLFTSCIAKISSVFVDNAEDLDVVMPLYNLLEYSYNYFLLHQEVCGIIFKTWNWWYWWWCFKQ